MLPVDKHSGVHSDSVPPLSKSLAPLVVDLDGTLASTDTLLEAVVRAVRRQPLDALRIPLWLRHGRAAFKAKLAARTRFSAANLPYHKGLLDYLREQRGRGRRIILATAADKCIADSVADHLGLFDQVLASDGSRNLKGVLKLAAIRSSIGERFVYAGDSAADRPIWKAAEAAVIVGAAQGLEDDVRRVTAIEQLFPRPRASLSAWLRALRVHQWLKNLLLFVPLLTSFAFLDGEKVLAATLAFVAFSAIASATYLLNDLADLESDRSHPRKRARPLASAQITIPAAIVGALGLLFLGFSISSLTNRGVVATLATYVVVTIAYTGVLKTYVLIDVLTLAMLYTLRVVAGALAISVELSSWLLAFSVFVFLSLALVKRCSELLLLGERGELASKGRDYRVADLVVLWPLGVGAALCSVVVFWLFVSTVETQARYGSRQLLWLVGFGLIYWLARMWIKTVRGEMHDDPVVFAMRDRGSRATILAILVVTIAAYFLRVDI